jgi:hypothetical protein
MFEENIASETIGALICKNLLINCPGERLSNLIAQIGHSLYSRILCIVCIDDAHEVIFGESLEVEEKILDHLQILIFLGRHSREKA